MGEDAHAMILFPSQANSVFDSLKNRLIILFHKAGDFLQYKTSIF